MYLNQKVNGIIPEGTKSKIKGLQKIWGASAENS